MKKNQIIFLFLLLTSVLILIFIYLYPDFWNGNSEYEWRVLWHGRKKWAVLVFFIWIAVLWIFFELGKIVEKIFKGKSGLIFALILFLLGGGAFSVFSQINQYAGYELLIKVFVPDHNSYYVDALRYRSKKELVNVYKNNLLSLHTHSRTHPPFVLWLFFRSNEYAQQSQGLKALYKKLVSDQVIQELKRHFQVSLGEQAGGFLSAIIMLFCGAVSLVLSYFILRRFYPALFCYFAGLGIISAPIYSLRAPVMDQVFGIFILAPSLLVLAKSRSLYLRMILAGIFLGFGIWMSPGVWSGMLLIFLLLLAENRQEKKPLKELFSKEQILGFFLLLLFLFGTIILISFWMGISYLEVFHLNRLGFHFNNQIGGRLHHWKWMLFNPYEYLFWLSLPFIWGLLGKIIKEIKQFQGKRKLEDYFFWALIGFFLILDLSAQLCYESPRLLWFLSYLMGASLLSGLFNMKNFHSYKWLIVYSLSGAQTCLFHLIY